MTLPSYKPASTSSTNADDVRRRFANSLPNYQQPAHTDSHVGGYTKRPTEGQNVPMSDGVTHYELDAKIESLEARADARFSKLETSISNALDEIRRDNATLKTGFSAEQLERRQDMKSLRTTIIGTAIGAVLTIVIGVAAFNATVLSNMVASFESGKNTASAIAEATNQMKQTQEQLKIIQDKLGKQAEAAQTIAK